MSTDAGSRAPVRPGAIYRLAYDLSALPADLELYNVEWGVLFALSGEHTVAEIGDYFGLDGATTTGVFRRLLEHGLIEERAVAHGEYLRAQATVTDRRPRTLAAFLRGAAAPRVSTGAQHAAERPQASPPRPATPPPVPPAPPSAARESVASPSPQDPWRYDQDLTRPVPTVRRSGDTIAFQPLGSPDAPSPPAVRRVEATPLGDLEPDLEATRRLSLERMMRFIIDRAPDLNAGQLDVYRVFIRVDTTLLKRNGITTLRFADDHLIDDPELQQAITTSVSHTLGIDVPETVFVAA
ncbi:MAG: helix-turn-helix domain-containing protein [Acidobacteriota bacterium]